MEIQPLTAQIDVVIDKQTLINKINQLQQTIEILTAQKTQLEQDLATATTQIESLNGQIQSLTAQITDLQSQINSLHSNLDLINGEIVENKTEYLLETKNQIKNAIIDRGTPISSSDTFRDYATKIGQISTGDIHTLLLMHFDESISKDNSIYNNIAYTYGNPTLSTAKKKFGNSSLYLDGSSNIYISKKNFPNTIGYNFTIEFWAYFTNLTTSYVFSKYDSSGYGIYMLLSSSNLFFSSSGAQANGTIMIASSEITLNTWTHIAFAKAATTGKVFFNGTLKATKTYTTSSGYSGLPFVANPFVIGSRDWNGYSYFTGYIDELRISDVCRYTEDFTPPTEPFSV